VPFDRANPPFHALERTRAFEAIIVQIEQAIGSGQLAPGDRLPSERELARTFGVSRSSVREALRVLEMFGVVTARRGSGADSGSTVRAGAETGLARALRLHSALLRIPERDLVDARILLETHAVRAAAERAEPDAVEPLRELLARIAQAGSPEELDRLDAAFHAALGALSGNALLPVLVEALHDSTGAEDWEAARALRVAEHEQVLDAIERGDGDEAAAVLERRLLLSSRP
jgi:GntR family transcriptional regulator, transcriptional repressor for pyruvate dehydrogenase complex